MVQTDKKDFTTVFLLVTAWTKEISYSETLIKNPYIGSE